MLDRITLGQLVTRYRDEILPTKKSCQVETYILNAFLRDPLCKRKLSTVTKADFAAYRDRRLVSISANSLSRQISPLRAMFEVARHEWNLPLRGNPLAKLKLGSTGGRRQRRIGAEELDVLIRAAKQTRNPFILPMILLALETGMRRGELIGLEWENIDFRSRTAFLPMTKNGESRFVPLSPKALEVFGTLPVTDTRIFPALTGNAVRLAWERMRKRAGLEDLHFHDLRHEAVSRFFEKGLSIPEVALVSGHKDPRALFRYTHMRVREIAEKLSASSS
ncbi:tyrosine-type recombinase/integrase [Pseudaminobacter soli (ex Zhang et al. 2022)]|uniref:tyrosine-type recombinase/integrase n=1 Tax=Pseudaminobacter soli (ex Zhang et al. 2022) TaxID=2831468 RepID=UPI00308063FD